MKKYNEKEPHTRLFSLLYTQKIFTFCNAQPKIFTFENSVRAQFIFRRHH